MTRSILWMYGIVSLANVIATGFSYMELDQFTKPFIIPLLILYVYQSSLGKTTLRILILCVALLFSWLGDIVLIYHQSNEDYFVGGIGLFLVARITYTFALGKSVYQTPSFNLTNSLPFLIYAGVLLYFLFPFKDFTALIAAVYGLAITIMVITARFREGHTSNESYTFALVGGVLFLLSDSLLILNSFYTPIPYTGVFIMLTYHGAQLLLVMGILRHVE